MWMVYALVFKFSTTFNITGVLCFLKYSHFAHKIFKSSGFLSITSNFWVLFFFWVFFLCLISKFWSTSWFRLPHFPLLSGLAFSVISFTYTYLNMVLMVMNSKIPNMNLIQTSELQTWVSQLGYPRDISNLVCQKLNMFPFSENSTTICILVLQAGYVGTIFKAVFSLPALSNACPLYLRDKSIFFSAHPLWPI